ncbi:SDR family NAD(P)-dependent oxidoreductase [Actinoplanes sp. NPDC024001]|uniref:SDR family NAD(P)-dependent oxidoreductase n=1 Tax=Actinoplanes sp. NPDC024001 TaxID=3154598 RepID=UPI00340C41CF
MAIHPQPREINLHRFFWRRRRHHRRQREPRGDRQRRGERHRRGGPVLRADPADLADPAAVRELGADLARRSRPADVLVNNAGTIRRSPAERHSDGDWDLVLQVNLTAQFVLARAEGSAMATRGRGKIIFTASLLSIDMFQ